MAGKHVFCEKPISFTSEEVKDCYKTAQQSNKILFCGFNRRFDIHHQELKTSITEGKLGNVRLFHYYAVDPKTTADFVNSYIAISGKLFHIILSKQTYIRPKKKNSCVWGPMAEKDRVGRSATTFFFFSFSYQKSVAGSRILVILGFRLHFFKQQ